MRNWSSAWNTALRESPHWQKREQVVVQALEDLRSGLLDDVAEDLEAFLRLCCQGAKDFRQEEGVRRIGAGGLPSPEKASPMVELRKLDRRETQEALTRVVRWLQRL